ncbi:hypothetical protein EJ02DRAFT_414324 [Clathrospora elynae]|uniref:feruloyl esterase n=1 Tax=Clathrospora elynae TaxID=706981 RepID=A0A6A5S9P4_9PLEO|nr:hypothetical protein EJ02DRAFT_414324 [Clathrospora elynae]
MALRAVFILIATFLHLALAALHPQSTLTTRASSGCGKTAILPGLLSSSGILRSYTYHLPASYDLNKAYPVVLGFHGSSSIGVFFEVDTKLDDARYSGNKIMVYPNGIDGSWAGPSYHTESTVRDDVQFVADVVADVERNFCVEEGRIFGVGMSNGGGFIGTLACDPVGSKIFRAYAAHSGAFYTDINGPNNGCAPAKVVPILEIHGTSDKTVKYEGGMGEGGLEPPISSWLEWWAQRNKCTSKSEETLNDGKVLHQSWTCDGKVGLLQHYKVKDLGHCWADTEINFSQRTVPQGPSVIRASEIVMKFFDSM